MKKTINVPQPLRISYELNPRTGYYIKSFAQKTIVAHIKDFPFELKLIHVSYGAANIDASKLLVSGDGDGNYFFADLHEIGKNWYKSEGFVSTSQTGKTRLILYEFSEDKSRLFMYYYPDYLKPPKRKLDAAIKESLIPAILHKTKTNKAGVYSRLQD